MGWRRYAVALLAVVAMAGCRTAEDATAAATQMSATAKLLSDYYAALGVILAGRDEIGKVNAALYAKPYPDASRKGVETTEAELAKRAAMASDLSTLTADFAALAGSTAAADVSAACGKLEAEVDGLVSHTASSTEQNAIKLGLEALVTAVKAHKEREAAKDMEQVATALDGLLDKEAPVWRSEDVVYLELAATQAGNLARQNAVDGGALLKPALEPFGLAPAPVSAEVSTKLTPLLQQQIAEKKAAQLAAYDQASAAMSAALKEMGKRIDRVASDKPMEFRLPPPSLDEVEKWANAILAK